MVQSSTVNKLRFKRQVNTRVITLRGKPKQKVSSTSKLCSGVTISLSAMRISRISSHQ